MEWVIWNGLFGIDYWNGVMGMVVRQSRGEVG